MLHPEVATRDCNHCLLFVYDEDTGLVQKNPDGTPSRRPKAKVRKGRLMGGSFAPCRQHALKKRKNPCPKGTPENPKSLSDQNRKAYQHYLECKATGHWPNDPIVRRNAAIIRAVEEEIEAAQVESRWKTLFELLSAAVASKVVR